MDNFRKVISIKLQEKSKEKVLEAVKLLEQREDVVRVSPDYKFYFREFPNDQSFTSSSFISSNGTQWEINGSTWNISASAAWDITRGSSEVIVGIIDTGIHSSHKDLENRVDVGLSRDFTKTNPLGCAI